MQQRARGRAPVEIQALGPVTIRGKAQPVEVFGVSPEVSPAGDASAAR